MRRKNKTFNLGCGALALGLPLLFAVWFALDSAFYGDVYEAQKRRESTIALESQEHRAEENRRLYSTVVGYTEIAAYGGLWFGGIAGVIVLGYMAATTTQKRMQIEKERYLPESGVYALIPVGDGVLFNPNTHQFIDSHSMRVIQSEFTPQAMLIDGAVRKLGTYDGNHRMNAAEAKMYAGAYDKPIQIGEPTMDLLPAPNEEIVPIGSIREALDHSDATDWIIGTADNGACSWFNVLNDANALLVGRAGSGKTASTAMMMVLHARLNDYAVTVLDGKDGLDWKPVGDAGLIDWRPLDHENIGFYVEALQREYKRRNEILAANGCKNLGEYQGGDMPRMLVVFEELGGTIQDVKTYGGDAKLIVGQLGGLMKRCRAAGIHFLLIDQSPDKDTYTNGVKVNCRYFAYCLPGHQAKVINAPEECKALGVGQFVDDGEVFRAWHTDEEMPLMRAVGKTKWLNLLPQPGDGGKQVVQGQISPLRSGDTSARTTSRTTSVQAAPLLAPANTTISTTLHHPDTTPAGTGTSIDWSRYSRLKGDRLKTALIDELPKLEGEPIEQHEIDYALDAYLNLSSRNMVYIAVWGSKNTQRLAWLNDVIDTHSDDDKDSMLGDFDYEE